MERIRVEGISKHFGRGSKRVDALRDVSFVVGAGEIFGLLGSNSAGKSTMVSILSTLMQPSAGSASVTGVDVVAHPAQVRRSIGVVLQSSSVDGSQTGRRLLGLHARLHGYARPAARRRVDELVAMLDLGAFAERRIDRLSGGVRRRFDLALALVHRPTVLYLDEPTGGLDPTSRLALWDEIRALRDEGTTILLTTQQLDEAERLADRVAFLGGASIVTQGSPAELKRALVRCDAPADASGGLTLEDVYLAVTTTGAPP
jgi:ABC-2 type transport system ATP-binding protein